MKLLLIGYLPPPIGGVTVLFKQLVEDLKNKKDLDLFIVDLSTKNKSFNQNIINTIKKIYLIVRKIFLVDVISFHGKTKSTFILGPFVYIISLIFHKKIIFRKFGGVFHKKYRELPMFVKKILKKTIFRADMWLFETKEIVKYFKPICRSKVKWYPNNRMIHKSKNLSNKARKFVFISQIKRTKGVETIFKISNQLPNDINVDLFGPMGYDISKSRIDILNEKYSANYQGVLSPKDVLNTLNKYDVLLLPTYHYGEGYPGIIIEAYSCGLPVITSEFNSIPEIVSSDSGILINPKRKKELFNAIIKIYKNDDYFAKLQKGAIKQSKFFNSKKWSRKFYNLCSKLT